MDANKLVHTVAISFSYEEITKTKGPFTLRTSTDVDVLVKRM